MEKVNGIQKSHTGRLTVTHHIQYGGGRSHWSLGNGGGRGGSVLGDFWEGGGMLFQPCRITVSQFAEDYIWRVMGEGGTYH